MSNTNDGGPAYPVQWMDFQPHTGEQVVREQYPGMTLRDWFAGQALVGILSKLPLIDQTGELGKQVPDKVKLNDDIADSCYCIADALLKARNLNE